MALEGAAPLSAPDEAGRSPDRGRYLAGTNTRRVRRALAALFEGAVGKDVVSRTWRRVRTDWEAWNARELHDEDIVRLILDGTVVRAKIDRKATAIALLVAIGVRRDGQKVLLALKNMGGESTAAWTAFLEDMARRGLKAPSFIIVDGAPGLEAALAALWPDIPVQRCTVGLLKKPLPITRRGSSFEATVARSSAWPPRRYD
jgi:putative transposase